MHRVAVDSIAVILAKTTSSFDGLWPRAKLNDHLKRTLIWSILKHYGLGASVYCSSVFPFKRTAIFSLADESLCMSSSTARHTERCRMPGTSHELCQRAPRTANGLSG